MNKSPFIMLKAADPWTDDPTAYNEMYLRPNVIMHFEPYSGPVTIAAWGPNGTCQPTGKCKHVLGGTLVALYSGGTRVFLDTPSEIATMIVEHESETEFS